jgi:hypothetical protein
VTGGQKGQKPERYDLFPFDALDEVARVYGEGAKKYEDHNWLRGYRWSLSVGALCRHIARFMCGEDRDPETRCLHLAHAAWHCLTLVTFKLRGLGTDDRCPPKTSVEKESQTAGSRLVSVGAMVRILDGRYENKVGPVLQMNSHFDGHFAQVADFGWYHISKLELLEE